MSGSITRARMDINRKDVHLEWISTIIHLFVLTFSSSHFVPLFVQFSLHYIYFPFISCTSSNRFLFLCILLKMQTEVLSLFVCWIVVNATFNNISVISWRSVLLVEENGWSGENHRPVASHWQTLSNNVVHLALGEIRTHN